MKNPKKRIRFLVIYFPHRLHSNHPWIVFDLLQEDFRFCDSKKSAYNWIQENMSVYDSFFDITESKDEE